MHPLDNVIWQALTTRQNRFAEVYEGARRFPREVTALSAFAEPTSESYRSLAGLVGPGGTAGLFLDAPFPDAPFEARDGWELAGGAPLLQMVSENAHGNGDSRSPAGLEHGVEVVELGPQDSPEMVELTMLTKPGPFGSRTHELGTYLGIRREGKLVAMAGERLKVPGHTEVSAVCTHPHCLGRGYAAILMGEVMRRIRDRGETTFLHVRQDNLRAIALYERIGFRERIRLHFAVIRRVQGGKDQ